MLLSVVVPCFNEEDVIETTAKRLSAVLFTLDCPYEIIFVDDGSSDSTPQKLMSLHDTRRNVKVVSFSRNFGHQAAVTAGLSYATGDAVVLMDADLQDPPEVICCMLEKWREGYKVVYGRRRAREGEGRFKRLSASLFYRVLNRLSEIPIPLDTGDFRLMDRCVVEELDKMPEHYRFIRGMVAWVGYKQTAVEYVRAKRFAGKTKYPLRKMILFASDGLLSFSVQPLRMVTRFGMLVSTLSSLVILYALATGLLGHHQLNLWTCLVCWCGLLGGVQLMGLGIIGEYLGRVYGEAKRRPLYIVDRASSRL